MSIVFFSSFNLYIKTFLETTPNGPVLMILGFMIMVVGVYVMYKQWKAASTHKGTGITNNDKDKRLSV
jgi:hypothetical protein